MFNIISALFPFAAISLVVSGAIIMGLNYIFGDEVQSPRFSTLYITLWGVFILSILMLFLGAMVRLAISDGVLAVLFTRV